MISLPLIIVNCDRCRRSVQFTGWFEEHEIKTRLRDQDWGLRLGVVECPDCVRSRIRDEVAADRVVVRIAH